MRFLKTGAVALSAVALMGLTACGGGGDAGNTPKPDASTQSAAVADGTLTLVARSNASFPLGSYQLNTAYPGASGTVPITGHTLEWIYPENGNFKSGIFFSQNDPRKFIMGLLDQGDEDTAYQCVSSDWTPAELAELGDLLEEAGIASMGKCASTVNIDAANHRIWFNNLHLTSLAHPAKVVTLSANFGWLLQPSGLSGSGSGLQTSASEVGSVIGSVIGTGSVITAPIASPSGPLMETPPDARLVEQTLEELRRYRAEH